MSSSIRHVVFATVLAALASACGSSSSTSVTAPTARCGVNASAQPASIAAPGGTGAIVVATNRECAWEARSDADWLSLSGASGQGDGSVAFAATANAQVAERRGTVLVNGVRVEITQGPAPCVYSLDRLERSIDANGGRVDVAISAQGGCTWSTASQVPWITVATGATGQGTGVVTLLVQENDAPARRTGTATIAGQTYTVEQDGATTPIPIPPVDPSCTYAVEPLSRDFGADGGTGEVAVTASAGGCAWASVSAVPWIRIEGSGNETGSRTVRYVVSPNPTAAARAGTLIVAGVVVTVTQAAAGLPPAPTPCTLAIAPATTAFPAEGGASEVAVSASEPGCAWTAQPAVGWITIQGAAGGTGPGRLRFAVAANTTSAARSGALVVAGVTVTITQAAAATPPPPPPPCTFTIAPATASFTVAGGTGEIVVTASAATCAWTASSAAPWLTITSGASGTGSGRVTYAVPAQTATADRTGTLTVAGSTVTVTQAGVVPVVPCTFSIAPNVASYPATGGTGEIAVTASAPTCVWNATSAAGWLTIQGSAGGTGSGRLTYSVAGQTGTTERSGTMNVAGFTVTVTQAAAPPPPPPPCAFTVSPLEIPVALLGAANIEVRVETAATCAWTAVSQANWITINGAASGTGSGSIRVTVGASLLTGRTGTLLVAGQTVTVNQTGLLGAQENRD